MISGRGRVICLLGLLHRSVMVFFASMFPAGLILTAVSMLDC